MFTFNWFFKGFFNSCNMIVKKTSLLISRVRAIKIAAVLIFPLIFIAKFLINEANNKVARCTANVTITRAGSGLSAKVKIDLSMSNENGIFILMGMFITMMLIMVKLAAGFF